MRNISDKIVEKIRKKAFYGQLRFFKNPSRLGDNVEKYCRARQATDDNVIRHVRIVYWITKPTDTHTHTHTHTHT